MAATDVGLGAVIGLGAVCQGWGRLSQRLLPGDNFAVAGGDYYNDYYRVIILPSLGAIITK
jgi:hypothetical protein